MSIAMTLLPTVASADEGAVTAMARFDDGASTLPVFGSNSSAPNSHEAAAPQSATPSNTQLLLSAHAGVSQATNTTGAVTGLTGLVRLGPVLVGGLVELERTVFDHSLNTFAAAAGVAFGKLQGVQIDALLVGGQHSYDDLDGTLHLFGSQITGDRASLPFLGTRLSASYALGQGHLRFEPGVMAFVEQDLMGKTIQVTRTSPSSFAGEPAQSSSEPFAVPARLRVGAGLKLGVTFDL